MKIILRADVEDLGHRGDVIEVADGYGRNYLVPRGLAMLASEGAERQAKAMRRSREVKDAREKGEAEEMAVRLTGTTLRLAARAGDGGRLFGSVTAADIVTAASEQAKVTLDRKVVDIAEAIKEVGVHTVWARPHAEVEFPLTIEVIADE